MIFTISLFKQISSQRNTLKNNFSPFKWYLKVQKNQIYKIAKKVRERERRFKKVLKEEMKNLPINLCGMWN